MSGDPPPSFSLVTLKKRTSKAELMVGKGTAGGQSSGKSKLPCLEPSLGGGPSRPENSERTSVTGLSGKVARSSGLLVGSFGPAGTSASMGPAGPAGPAEG